MTGSGGFDCRFEHFDGLEPSPSVCPGFFARSDGTDERPEFGQQRLFRRAFDLGDRAFDPFEVTAVGEVGVLIGFDLVLGGIVIANGAESLADYDHLAKLAGNKIIGLDGSPNGSARQIVLEGKEGGVIHLPPEKVVEGGEDFNRHTTEQKVEKVHEMNSVGEHDPAVIARAFEAAEVPAQNPHSSEQASLNLFLKPEGGGIESENVADLENPGFSGGQLGELAGLGGFQSDRFFDEDVATGGEEVRTDGEMRLGRGYDDGGIDFLGEAGGVGGEMALGNADFPGGFEPFGVFFCYEEFDRERVEHSQVICAPSADA